METWHLFFRGRVQGVGFRWTCKRAAESLGISGWVRNRSDGSVEAVVHGAPADLRRFVESVKTTTHGHVESVDRCVVDPESFGASAGRFEIRDTV